MLDPHLTDQEKQCLRILSKLFSEGKDSVSNPRQALAEEGLRLEYQEFRVVMERMDGIGALRTKQSALAPEGQFILITISPKAVQLRRELERLDAQPSEPRDIVAEIKDTAKGNRLLAWFIIGFIVLTALVTFLNQLWQLLERTGILDAIKARMGQ